MVFETNTGRYLAAIGVGLLLATLAILLGASNIFTDWVTFVPVFYIPRNVVASEWVKVYLYWILVGLILAGLATWSKRFFIVALVLVLVIHTAVVIVMYNYKTLGM